MASKPGVIPISDAADICKKRGCAYVIVFGLRADGEKFHVTTYGMTKALCRVAGAVGDRFADAVLDGRVHPPEVDPLDAERADNARLRAAVADVLALTDTGSAEFREMFASDSSLWMSRSVPGWRVVERIRERLLEVTHSQPQPPQSPSRSTQ